MNAVRRSSWLIPLVLVFGVALCPVSARAAVAVSIGQNFAGVAYGTYNTNSQALPPDSNGAIGPAHYEEFINGIFAVYNKTNGHPIRSAFKTDVDFWAAAGVGIDVGNGATVSDPRIIYDPQSQRWFASEIDVNIQVDFNTLTESFGT